MKEQNKSPEEELSEVEISSLSDKEFKVMIIMMLKKLGRRMYEHSEQSVVSNKELENVKKNQTQLKNIIIIIEIKNTLEGINNSLDDTEGQISKLEDRVVEISQAKQEKEFLKMQTV